ncbi:MAG: hypothetical protein A2W98_08520 [Bacteroidetes bacterium GWF2_33_38]|nr:MAG: hypothetical protein A2W98_08520 [Bacteroidetes bacterium GWF2_33_38]
MSKQEVPSFVSEKNLIKILNKDNIIDRKIKLSESNEVSERIETKVNKLVSELIRNTHKSFLGIKIFVKEGDGMSWTAEMLRLNFKSLFPTWNINCFNGISANQGLPEIIRIIGKNRLIKLAKKSGLTNSFKLLEIKFWILIFFCLLICVILPVYFSNIFNDNFKNYIIGISALLTFISVAVLRPIFSKWIVVDRREAIHKLVEEIHKHEILFENGNGSEEYNEFIKHLVQAFRQSPSPRFIIVDNIDGLDNTTKRVLNQYLLEKHDDIFYKECWVVFSNYTLEYYGNHLLGENYSLRNPIEQFLKFELQSITLNEKSKLIEFLNLSQLADKYTTLKQICCEPNIENLKQLKQILLKFQKDEQNSRDKYSAYDLLFLLSLSSLPNILYFNKEFLLKSLKKSKGRVYKLRARILELILKGTNLSMEEFRICFIKISNIPVIYEEVYDGSSFRITVEAKDILTSNNENLGYFNPAIGHLFWTLFWYDKLQKVPLRKTLLRRLYYHLCESNLIEISDLTLKESIVVEIINIYLYTIEKCTNLMLVQEGEKAFIRCIDFYVDYIKHNEELVKKFIIIGWDLFAILNSKNILSTLSKLYQFSHNFNTLNINESYHNGLWQVFFELNSSLKIYPTPKKEDGQSIRETFINSSIYNYGKIVSTLFCLTYYPVSGSPSILNIPLLVLKSRETIKSISKNFEKRISDSNTRNLSIIELISLSKSTFCSNLLIENYTANKISHALINSELVSWSELFIAYVDVIRLEIGTMPTNQHIKCFFLTNVCINELKTLECILNYSEKKQELYHKTDKVDDQTILVELKLLRESCLNCISILVRLIKEIPELIINTNLIERANIIFDLKIDTLSIKNGDISQNVINDIHSQFYLDSMLWDFLDMKPLKEFSILKGAYFKDSCINVGNDIESDDLNDNLSILKSSNSFLSIIGYLLLAKKYSSSIDLSSVYFKQAFNRIYISDYGMKIKAEFAFLSCIKFDSTVEDYLPYLNVLLFDKSGLTYFDEIINKINDDDFSGVLINFLNIAKSVQAVDMQTRIFEKLNCRLSSIKNEKLKRELSCFVQATEIKIKNKVEKQKWDELLNSWKDRRDTYAYASILRIIVNNLDTNEIICLEILSILSNRNPSIDSYNSYFLLAIDFVLKAPSKIVEDNKVLLQSYLLIGLDTWQNTSSEVLTIEVNEALYRIGSISIDSYNESFLNWITLMARLKKEGEFNFFAQLDNTRAFLMLKSYIETMRNFGISFDIGDEEYYIKLNANPYDQRKFVNSWKENRAETQIYKIEDNQLTILSEAFISGNFLFKSPLLEDMDYDTDRDYLNNLANDCLNFFIKYILERAQTPELLKEMISSNEWKQIIGNIFPSNNEIS